jgi:predicted amidophosphoribosyltransferase
MARAGAALLQTADVLVPVPLHRWRLFHRRYNQAALLAKAVGRIAGRACALDGLQRVRSTASLGEKSAVERAAEVADAFTVPPRRARLMLGRHVLLIDDVMTSGATCNACARALLAAGATSVDVLVAARVPDPRSH